LPSGKETVFTLPPGEDFPEGDEGSSDEEMKEEEVQEKLKKKIDIATFYILCQLILGRKSGDKAETFSRQFYRCETFIPECKNE